MKNEVSWIEEARAQAAQCWCTPETSSIVMDVVLCEAVAQCIAAWMDTAALAERNVDYYRGLVERCGKASGAEAYIQDDGGVVPDVLCAKVPELVETYISNSISAKEHIGGE